jgi:hypothetical protein
VNYQTFEEAQFRWFIPQRHKCYAFMKTILTKENSSSQLPYKQQKPARKLVCAAPNAIVTVLKENIRADHTHYDGR